jgi:hypothetical protein
MGAEVTVRSYFDAIAAHPREPRLARAIGVCQFDIEGAGTFAIGVDRGTLALIEGPSAATATCRLRMRDEDFVRLARGDGHENLTTALLRGAIRFEGDLRFLAELQAILPAPADWSVA